MYRTLNKPNPALLTDLEPSSLPALGEEPSSGQQGISTYFRERSKRHTLSMLLEHYTPMLDGDSSTSPSGSWSNPGFHGVPASPFSFCTSIMEPMPGLEQGTQAMRAGTLSGMAFPCHAYTQAISMSLLLQQLPRPLHTSCSLVE